PQLRRDDRHRFEDHPLGLVLRGDERRDDLEELARTLLLLALARADLLAEARSLLVEVQVLQQGADRLGPPAAAGVDSEALRRPEAVLELAEDLLVVDDQFRLELPEELPRLLEAADRVDRGLARVVAARLDCDVHLADLQRPLHDRVEVLLLDAAVGAQAEVVRELAEVLAFLPRVDHVAEEPVAELACLVEVLDVDALDELDVVLVDLVALEERVDDAMDVLRDRTLLRAGRLRHVLLERLDRLEDLLGGDGDLLELTRGELAVVADRRVPDELANLLRVLGRDLRDQLDEEPVDELAHVLERRQ